MNTRTQIEISVDRNNLITELSKLTSQDTKSDADTLRIQEINTLLNQLNEEESRLQMGIDFPGKK